MIKEKCLGFKNQHSEMTREALASTILKAMYEFGLNEEFFELARIRWQWVYYGWFKKGCQQRNTSKVSFRHLIQCASHIFNLSIASSCSLPLVRNMMGTVSE